MAQGANQVEKEDENHTPLYTPLLFGANDSLVLHRDVYPDDELRVALY